MKGAHVKIKRFISANELHRSIPVRLRSVVADYDLEVLPASCNVIGFSVGNLIAINEKLPRLERRATIAHEIAHRVLRHPNSLFLEQLGPWWYSRFELEAQEGAAMMLVPLRPLLLFASDGWTIAEISRQFSVPEEMARLRLRMERIGC